MRTTPPPVRAGADDAIALVALAAFAIEGAAEASEVIVVIVAAIALTGMLAMIAFGNRTASGLEITITRGSRGAPGNSAISVPWTTARTWPLWSGPCSRSRIARLAIPLTSTEATAGS
jgi:hypothetical protein